MLVLACLAHRLAGGFRVGLDCLTVSKSATGDDKSSMRPGDWHGCHNIEEFVAQL